MTMHHRAFCRSTAFARCVVETLEDRRLLAVVTLNPGSSYQTIQGWGTAAVYPTNLVSIAQAGNIMRDAGMNVVRITAGAGDYTRTVGGNIRTPVPISADLQENVDRFFLGDSDQTRLIDWLKVNGLEPERTKMIGALWSPPHWLKISTGRLMTWDFNGPQSAYDPIIPWGDYGGNTGGGRVDPTKYTDWARYVLSTIKKFEQETGLPMHAFSFQNEPNVPATYNAATIPYLPKDINDLSQGFTSGHWEVYGDQLEALANERALHPEITTKIFGPELSQLGGGASNPYYLPDYNKVRQDLISRGLLDDLGGWATHEYTYPADSAAMWDAWYSGSAHAAQIINGTNTLGWLGPTPGIAGDNKEIWQTESEGEDQSWTKDGAMGFGLKIYNALVHGNVSGYTSWTLTGYDANDEWGVVKLADINNPTNSFKFDAFKHFSRWIRPGAQRINATFENGQASIGGAHALDTYNGLNVSAFNHAEDERLTMVFVNMKTAGESTTISIPAGMNVSSFQVYQTTGSQKYVQLADLIPSNGQITLTVPASGFVTITGSYATATLPAPWVANDVGSPSPAGSSGYNAAAGTFTVAGGGSDIWNTSDQFHFVSQGFTGNGSVIARVTSLQNTNTWAKSGVMFRASTDANAMFADMVVTPGQGVSFQWRASTGANCGFAQVTGIAAPVWVKLVRNGNSFTGFYATTAGTPTASDWIQVGTAQTIAMGTTVQAGLAVTSHNNGTLATSTLTDVQLDQAPTVATAAAALPSPVNGTTAALSVLGADGGGEANLTYNWVLIGTPPGPVTFSANGTNAAKNTVATFTKAGTYSFQVTITDADGYTAVSAVNVTVGFGAFTDSVDIGAPATAGSLSYTPGTGAYTIQGGGADIWGTADQFRYSYTTLTGNAAAVARVNSVTNTNGAAKAGVMFRNSNAASAAFAFVWLAPNGTVHFETRSTSGVSASYSASAAGGTPVWVRLIRGGSGGNQFTAFFSLDGTTWTQVGTTQTVTMASTALAGLAVTSHNNTAGVLNTASFDNFALNAPDTNAPILNTVVSRKTHGAAGSFDLGLSLDTAVSPTVEPRLGGPSWLVFNFNEPIRAADGVLDASEFSLTNAAFDSASISGNTLTLRFANVANRARVTIGLPGIVDASGNALAGTGSVTIRSLYGDVNRNGLVSVTDQQAVKNGLFQTVTIARFLLDLNLNGTISVVDQQAVKNALFDSVT